MRKQASNPPVTNMMDLPLFAMLVETSKPKSRHNLSQEDIQEIIFGTTPPVLQKLIPIAGKLNYLITNNDLAIGTPREKFEKNIQAIQTLKRIEKENRFATPDEQTTLAGYVGWGGLSEAFDTNNKKWKKEFQTLKVLLTNSEYQSAMDSTLTSFYTPPVVIEAIYQALERMGFMSGNILEPSCGVGAFFGKMPSTIREKSRLYGVELDSISGRISQQLYQGATIAISGFETAPVPDGFYDLAIGNIPFGQYTVHDPDERFNHYSIHDYFFVKTIEKIRPGGMMAFITSKYSMDKKDDSIRRYISERTELIGAIRLPNTTFKKNAGTMVTSDIIFLKKRDRQTTATEPWVSVGTNADGFSINQYFIDHPEMILGEIKEVSTAYGFDTACLPRKGAQLESDLLMAIANFTPVYIPCEPLEEVTNSEAIPADPTIKNFAFGIVDDVIYYRENSIMTPVQKPAITLARIKGMIGLRDCVRELIQLQLDNGSDEELVKKQAELSTLYDAFVIKYGRINTTSQHNANQRAFDCDDSYYLLCSLENFDDEGNFLNKADIFSKNRGKGSPSFMWEGNCRNVCHVINSYCMFYVYTLL